MNLRSLRTQPIEIETTPLFWDCECAEGYIHPASQAVCEHCHAQREEQPDARVSELPAPHNHNHNHNHNL